MFLFYFCFEGIILRLILPRHYRKDDKSHIIFIKWMKESWKSEEVG